MYSVLREASFGRIFSVYVRNTLLKHLEYMHEFHMITCLYCTFVRRAS